MSLNIGILSSAYKAASGGALLLDTYGGAAAAYSLRKLRTAYNGNCIRVIRTSDLAQQDIGFVNNVLDTTTLQTFIGSSSGSIVTWYDQSGNSRNATASNRNGLNLIIISGVLQTINSLPTIYLTSLNIPSFAITGDLSYFMVQKKVSSNKAGTNVGTAGVSALMFSNWSDNNIYFQRSNGITGLFIRASDSTTGNQILNAFNQSGLMSMYKNDNIYTINLSSTFGTASNNLDYIGISPNVNGYGSEIIIYTNSQLSNRTAINTNINSFYSFY